MYTSMVTSNNPAKVGSRTAAIVVPKKTTNQSRMITVSVRTFRHPHIECTAFAVAASVPASCSVSISSDVK